MHTSGPEPGSSTGISRRVADCALAIIDALIEISLYTSAGAAATRTSRVQWPDDTHATLLQSQNGQCAYCAKAITPRAAHIDHMTPVSRGGSNEHDNLQVLAHRVTSARASTPTLSSASATPPCSAAYHAPFQYLPYLKDNSRQPPSKRWLPKPSSKPVPHSPTPTQPRYAPPPSSPAYSPPAPA